MDTPVTRKPDRKILSDIVLWTRLFHKTIRHRIQCKLTLESGHTYYLQTQLNNHGWGWQDSGQPKTLVVFCPLVLLNESAINIPTTLASYIMYWLQYWLAIAMCQIEYFKKPLNKGHLFIMDKRYFSNCFHLRAVPRTVFIYPLSKYFQSTILEDNFYTSGYS